MAFRSSSPPLKRACYKTSPVTLPREILPARPGANLSKTRPPRAVFLRFSQQSQGSAKSFVLVVEPDHPLLGCVFQSISGFVTAINRVTNNGWEGSVLSLTSHQLPPLRVLRQLLRKVTNRGRNAKNQDRFLRCSSSSQEIITTGAIREGNRGQGFQNDDPEALALFHQTYQRLAETQLQKMHDMGIHTWLEKTQHLDPMVKERPYPMDMFAPRALPQWKDMSPQELVDSLCDIATKPIDHLVKKGIRTMPRHSRNTSRPKKGGISSFCPSSRLTKDGRFKQLTQMRWDQIQGIWCTGNCVSGSGCHQTCLLPEFCCMAVPPLYRSVMEEVLSTIARPDPFETSFRVLSGQVPLH